MSRIILMALLPLTIFINGCVEPQQAPKKHKFLSKNPKNMHKAHQTTASTVQVQSLKSGLYKIAGTVEAHRDLENMKIMWKIPKNAKLVSGTLISETNLVSESSQLFSITVQGLVAGDKIVLLPYQMINGEMHGTPQVHVFGRINTEPSFLKQKSIRKKPKKIFQ